jgi:iron complex transport system permease protein
MAHTRSALRSGALPLALLVVAAAAGLLFALATGSVSVPWQELWAILAGDRLASNYALVTELRLPRALTAFACGGMLALAGALMQVMLRNPLADPYILGVSGGAAVGALLSLLLGVGGARLTGGAFIGALSSMFMVFVLAHGGGTWTSTRLLLTGVVVAAGWSAAISLILSFSADTTLRGMIFWLLGDLSQASHPVLGLSLLVLGLLIALMSSRELNVLVHGDLKARTLGIAVTHLHLRLYVLASLLTATAITVAGNIGFIGLIVPHLVRLIVSHDHRILLPAATLLGATLLVVADTLARSVFAPLQLPVGVMTALIGVPVFLYLLRRSNP